jgi:DnaJ-class molecular chaperone
MVSSGRKNSIGAIEELRRRFVPRGAWIHGASPSKAGGAFAGGVRAQGLELIPDHYAVLGLDRRCTAAQVRSAYRLLAKRHHPDVNPRTSETEVRFREVTTAYETLCDPSRRRAYDRELEAREEVRPPPRAAKVDRSIRQDARLRIEDFLRGTELEVWVKDPANPEGAEVYCLTVPPGTAPGTRMRIPRNAPFEGGFVQVRLKALPGARFQVKGSDLRYDLRIQARQAENGGPEWIQGISGSRICVQIPRGVGRGEIVRVPGEGMPKPRGGRGDLLVRITYRPDVKISRRIGR